MSLVYFPKISAIDSYTSEDNQRATSDQLQVNLNLIHHVTQRKLLETAHSYFIRNRINIHTCMLIFYFYFFLYLKLFHYSL